MGTELRVREVCHHTAAVRFEGDHHGGASFAAARKRVSQPGFSRSGWSGVLLDFQGGSVNASLKLAALAAESLLAPVIGCPVDCAVTLPRPGGAALLAGNSGATALATADQGNVEGPVLQALTGRRVLIANGYTREVRWPGFQERLRAAGYRSLVSAPLPLAPESFAALTLLSRKDNAFTPTALAEIESFSEVAAQSFVSATEVREAVAEAGHLRTAMAGRTSIDVACGVIMGQNRCSYAEAFNILRKASSHRNIKIRILAENILADLPGGAPVTHFKK